MTVTGGQVRPAVPAPDGRELGRATAMWPGWPAVFGAAAGAAVFAVTREALPDDAYISLDYARNLAEAGHWGLLADRPSNTATSPLNVWALAGATLVLGRPVLAVGLVLVVTLALAGWWADGLRRELEGSRALPYLVVALLACSPLLVSTVGLETYLGAAALLGVGHYAAAGHRSATGALVGAAVLVRPDLAVPALALAIGVARASWRHLGVVAVVATLVVLPWHLFAWMRLGGFLPDTVWFKSGEAWEVRGQQWHFADGWLLYGQDFTQATLLTLAPAVAGLLAAVVYLVPGRVRRERRAALAFAGAGVAHWLAFAALGTAPYAWYLAPSLVCLAVTASLAVSGERDRGPRRIALGVAAVGVAGTVTWLAVWPWALGPINYNWGTAPEYAVVGTDVARLTGGEPVAAGWEIGTTAYFCRCPLLDWFGDRARTDELIASRLAAAGPVARTLAAWNFAHRAPTPPTPTTWVLAPGSPTDAAGTWRTENPAKGPAWGSLVRSPRAPNS